VITQLEKQFQKIGASVKIQSSEIRRRTRQTAPVTLDIVEANGKELFQIWVREDLKQSIDLSVLEVKGEDRHLLLLARQLSSNGDTLTKDHFLCGHDERHLFVASVEGVSTVTAAKDSLKPKEIREKEAGLNSKKRHRRKTDNFHRQGEWFFIPAQINPPRNFIRKNEPLVRGSGSKPHMAQFAYRTGGEAVRVCTEYPNGLTLDEYRDLIKANPRAKNFNWRDMQREATVYVKGRISHADHASIVLNTWHRVLMNTERRTEAVAFLD
jgi:hypothetical protein